jgi:hypothetical protein
MAGDSLAKIRGMPEKPAGRIRNGLTQAFEWLGLESGL